MKQAAATLPAIGVSLLPKLMCPACWPAYAGVLSAVGLSVLTSAKHLLLLTIAFLAITAFTLGFRGSRRHGYGPLWAGLLAAAMILVGKFYFDAEPATYAGVGLLVAASVWNSWPRPAAALPSCCFAAGTKITEGNLEGEKRYETQN
jgi:hypothetical protein